MIVELDKKEISARLRAVTYQERLLNMQNDSKTNMSIDERVKEDSDYRKYVRMPSQDAYRQTRKVIENCHMEEKSN